MSLLKDLTNLLFGSIELIPIFVDNQPISVESITMSAMKLLLRPFFSLKYNSVLSFLFINATPLCREPNQIHLFDSAIVEISPNVILFESRYKLSENSDVDISNCKISPFFVESQISLLL